MKNSDIFHPLDINSLREFTESQPLNNPFEYQPSQAILEAQRELASYIEQLSTKRLEITRELQQGKMLGLLIARDTDGNIGFLAGFSGCIAGELTLEGFVPPIFGRDTDNHTFTESERYISSLNTKIKDIESTPEYISAQANHTALLQHTQQERERLASEYAQAKAARNIARKANPNATTTLERESQHQKGEIRRYETTLKADIESSQRNIEIFTTQIEALCKERKRLSNKLQRQIFESHKVINGHGKHRSLLSIFEEWHHRLPPSGAGECAAPKLLYYALTHNLTPLSIGEFWYGAPPRGEVRHHMAFYGACKGRCEPILNYMLEGVNVEPLTQENSASLRDKLTTIYEDSDLLLLNKPSGMLSVPGTSQAESVASIVRELYPTATGAMMVHRLDQDTSGLLLVAKSAEVHKALQRQFAERSLTKRYIAILDGVITQDHGEISLPLAPNIEDRPRQMVDHKNGKAAHTTYKVLERANGHTRIELTPHTGRTHQLRIHCAHSEGLNTPIAGDRLYGYQRGRNQRLMLHAEQITFTHPTSGERLFFSTPAQF